MKKLFIGIFFFLVVAAGRTPAFADVMEETADATKNVTAEFNDVKVTLDDNSILLLRNPPVTITNEDSREDMLYLPLEDTLKALGYGVIRNEAGNRIKLDSDPEEEKTITAFLESNRITPDTKALKVIISNPTDDPTSWGEVYHLDTKIGDKWENLPYLMPAIFTAIGHNASSKSLIKVDVDIERIYGQLNPGLYRLVKKFSGEEFFLEFEVREYISNDIDSVEAADVKVELDGSLAALKKELLSVVKKDETEAVLYMHWEELKKSVGIDATLSEEQSVVELKSGNESSPDVVMSVREKQITTQTGEMTLDTTYYTESGFVHVFRYTDELPYAPGSSFLPGEFYIEKEINRKWEKLPDKSGGDLNGYYEVPDGENTTHYYIDIYKHYEHLSPGKHRIVRSYRTLYVETFYYTEFEVFE